MRMAYYNNEIRCYEDGRIERLNRPKSKYGEAGTWTEIQPTSFARKYLKIKVNGKTVSWHKVIWVAFNGEIPYGMTINHKDEIQTNNSLDNLELLTQGDNNRYGTRNKRAGESNKNGKLSKPLTAINVETGERTNFPSMHEAERMGFDRGAIYRCLKNSNKTHKGYRWER